MQISRREFLRILGMAGVAGMLPAGIQGCNSAADMYSFPGFGDIRLLHITDTHAQLMPVYYREPSLNLGFGEAFGRPPHLVGQAFLEYYKISAGSPFAYAYTSLDYVDAAQRFGKLGGFAHLKTLVDKMRGEFGREKTLLFDTGDTWQGSGTALWTKGTDMVDVCNLLGVDVMTGHWEFTHGAEVVRSNLERFKGDFVAQNVKVKEEALFDGVEAFDEMTGHAFRPYVMKELGGHRIAVIGQAFPYTPIANPQRFIPDWTFGINSMELQELVDKIRRDERPDAVILISHNGMDVDVKLAGEVNGMDVIFGGHTHDAVPRPFEVRNASGRTLVTNAGSNGKFLGVMDLELGNGTVRDYRYRLLPVFSNELGEDRNMKAMIDDIRKPYLDKLHQPLATTDSLLYRRGNFDGPFDKVICDALIARNDAQIALSPGFRWGTTLLPGQTVTMEHVLDQTCMTYPETYVRDMTGAQIGAILEDVADNLFNADPYYQQGGDMVRVGGMQYTINPSAVFGKRIENMRLSDGKPIDASAKYRVAGWATVGAQSPGEPVWESVAEYLKDVKTVEVNRSGSPVVKHAESNPGADFS